MDSSKHDWVTARRSRFAKLVDIDDEIVIASLPERLINKPWIAMVSSRLGHSPELHRRVCQFVGQTMLECRRRDAVLLYASKSAIEPWAVRAAELYDVSCVRLVVGCDQDFGSQNDTLVIPANCSRDAAVVAIADRVDAVYARRRGKIAKHVAERAAKLGDASTRVAVTRLKDCAAKDLVESGVVGWLYDTTKQAASKSVRDQFTPRSGLEWICQENRWLVHCTRARSGAWPGETEKQYRDAMLLSGETKGRAPIDSLRRIVRSGRLIAGAIATSKSYPVVCASAAPLADLILSRCYRSHLKRWDYEPYGIAIDIESAQRSGFRPVVYVGGHSESDPERESVPDIDQYLIQAVGNTFDWTHEREWRSLGDVDLSRFPIDKVRVFVATDEERKQIQSVSPWQVDAVLESGESG